jgi:hypothetical protein
MDEVYFWKDGKLYCETDGEVYQVNPNVLDDCGYAAY